MKKLRPILMFLYSAFFGLSAGAVRNMFEQDIPYKYIVCMSLITILFLLLTIREVKKESKSW